MRRAVFGLFALSLALLAGGLYAVSLFEEAPAPTLHRLVPLSADAYVSAFIKPSTDQQVALREVFGDEQSATSVVEGAFDGVLKRFGLRFKEHVREWVGAEVSAFSIGSDYALLLQTDDPAAALAQAQAMLERGSEERPISASYDGAPFVFVKDFSLTQRPLATGIVDSALVMGTPGAFRLANDASMGASLQDEGAFRSALGGLNPDRLVSIYVRDADLVASQYPGSINFAFGLLGVEGSPYGAVVYAEREVVVVESTVREPYRLPPQVVRGFLSFEI